MKFSAAVPRQRAPRLWAAVALMLVSLPLLGSDSRHLYVTWVGSEPDKAASAWYIKRHVDRDAVFEVLPQGTPIGRGTSFDTPYARFRRVHNASTMETLLRAYPSDDAVVRKIASITHDIEINLWQPKQLPESAVIDARMKEIDARHAPAGAPIECYIELFDSVYSWLAARRTDAASLRTPAVCEKGAGSRGR